MTTTLGSVTFEDKEVQRMTVNKTATMIVFDMPFADSENAEAYNWGGNIKRITLDGIVTEDTWAAARTKYNNIMGLMTSEQISSISFSCDWLATVQVKIESAECWLDSTVSPLPVFNFRINLVESK